MAEATLEQILGQVLGLAGASTSVDNSLRNFSRKPADAKAFSEYVKYARVPEPMKKEFATRLAKKSPLEVAEMMKSTQKDYNNDLASLVAGTLGTMLNSNNEMVLTSLAYGISGSYQAIEELKENLANREIDKAKKTMIEMTPFGQYKDWVTFITKVATEEDIAKLASGFVQTQKAFFYEQFSSVRGEGDKQEAYLDMAKVQSYINDTLAGMKDEDKPLALAYAGKALYASNEEARKAAEKAKKEQEAAGKDKKKK
ncbi:hypothetical protein FJZ17_03250 [Candidatus Pacearchaeota archaeon]|nr:hypothetical protein [Candidatus Pacearchaeota archaeon]